MRVLRSLLILSFLLAGAVQLYAFKDYEPYELPSLVSDFELFYDILNANGTPHSGSTVDGVKIIRFTREEVSSEVYDMVLYIDRGFVSSEEGIQIPYDFRWNFRGLSEGEHEFVFVFTGESGQKGVVGIRLSVEH